MKTALRLLFHLVVALLAIIGLHALLFPEMACAQPAELVRVNDEVNRSIRWVPQRDGMDTAQVLPAEGDCDDYVWSKFILLSREGVAWERMRAAHVTYRRQDHVVLIVDGWVLDNIERRVVTVETARRYYTGL
ncbi:MAG: transglutaminase-like cysteine peptidase [Brevundimonas sp.]|nr:transglutaminase-like cysteine peptidase [Brevundimonas sp.]